MTVKRCPHRNRTDAGDGEKVRCLNCGRVFVPRSASPKHGTYRGYSRHSRKRAGEWCWPPCRKCAEAGTQYRQAYALTSRAREDRHRRNAASMAASARLRRQYPGEYALAYADELRLRGGEEVLQHHEVPAWDDVTARLVKAATGYEEALAVARVREGRATRPESEVIRLASRLRTLFRAVDRVAAESVACPNCDVLIKQDVNGQRYAIRPARIRGVLWAMTGSRSPARAAERS